MRNVIKTSPKVQNYFHDKDYLSAFLTNWLRYPTHEQETLLLLKWEEDKWYASSQKALKWKKGVKIFKFSFTRDVDEYMFYFSG